MTIPKPKPTTTTTIAPPTERVPIMLEITDEDRQKARRFVDIHDCLICTALKRMGYAYPTAGPSRVTFGGHDYKADGMQSEDLNYLGTSSYPMYGPEVVGKQIILYPI